MKNQAVVSKEAAAFLFYTKRYLKPATLLP